jgi:hypothetical protein
MRASPPTGQDGAVIEATALTKVYPGDVTALAGLTVAFAPGVTGLPATAARERAAEALRHVGLHEERYRQCSS